MKIEVGAFSRVIGNDVPHTVIEVNWKGDKFQGAENVRSNVRTHYLSSEEESKQELNQLR